MDTWGIYRVNKFILNTKIMDLEINSNILSLSGDALISIIQYISVCDFGRFSVTCKSLYNDTEMQSLFSNSMAKLMGLNTSRRFKFDSYYNLLKYISSNYPKRFINAALEALGGIKTYKHNVCSDTELI